MMALTAVVTKGSVSRLNSHDYRITIHVVVTDETSLVLLEKDYSERYYDQTTIGNIKAKLQAELVSDWDEIVAEDDVYSNAAFDTMCSEIQTAANTYINP